MRRDAYALVARGDQRAVRCHLERHQRSAEVEIERGDVLRRGKTGELLRIVQAGQGDVAARDGGVDRLAGRVEVPQAQAQVGVVGDLHAGGARGIDCGLAGPARAVADRLADRRQVEELGAGDVVGGERRRLHERRRRILAQVVELVAGRAVGDEADPGRRRGMTADARGVDAFGSPQLEEGIAHPVLADTGEVARPRALPRRRNGDILRIAAEALQPRPAVAFLGPVELDQRFAERDDIGGGGHGAAGFPWCLFALKPALKPALKGGQNG